MIDDSKLVQREASARCPVCNGNDADAPCAYPEGGQPGCLRDIRLAIQAVAWMVTVCGRVELVEQQRHDAEVHAAICGEYARVEPLYPAPAQDAVRMLGDLLAVLHRDGGHRVDEVGLQQAFDEALGIAARVVQHEGREW